MVNNNFYMLLFTIIFFVVNIFINEREQYRAFFLICYHFYTQTIRKNIDAT
jgi:hypothetical protein